MPWEMQHEVLMIFVFSVLYAWPQPSEVIPAGALLQQVAKV